MATTAMAPTTMHSSIHTSKVSDDALKICKISNIQAIPSELCFSFCASIGSEWLFRLYGSVKSKETWKKNKNCHWHHLIEMKLAITALSEILTQLIYWYNDDGDGDDNNDTWIFVLSASQKFIVHILKRKNSFFYRTKKHPTWIRFVCESQATHFFLSLILFISTSKLIIYSNGRKQWIERIEKRIKPKLKETLNEKRTVPGDLVATVCLLCVWMNIISVDKFILFCSLKANSVNKSVKCCICNFDKQSSDE